MLDAVIKKIEKGKPFFDKIAQNIYFLNCKMKLELRNWDKGACPFIPIRAAAGPLFSIFL